MLLWIGCAAPAELARRATFGGFRPPLFVCFLSFRLPLFVCVLSFGPPLFVCFRAADHPSGKHHVFVSGVSCFSFDAPDKHNRPMSTIHHNYVPGFYLHLQVRPPRHTTQQQQPRRRPGCCWPAVA